MQKRLYHTPVPMLPPAVLRVLPPHLADAAVHAGLGAIEELRLHSGRACTVTGGGETRSLGTVLDEKQMRDILQLMCGGSLYAYSHTINQGFLTLEGGVRVGIAGTAAMDGGHVIGISKVTGMMIRIPHRVQVDASPIVTRLLSHRGTRGILIYAPPGVGKTTLLRAIAAQASSGTSGLHTVAVDTREELYCGLEEQSLRLDILLGYPRELGIEIAVRSLGAQLVICDEIGSAEDARAILLSANRGVPLVASAHAASLEELLSRPPLMELHRAHVFGTYVGLLRNGGCFEYRFCDWREANARQSPHAHPTGV